MQHRHNKVVFKHRCKQSFVTKQQQQQSNNYILLILSDDFEAKPMCKKVTSPRGYFWTFSSVFTPSSSGFPLRPSLIQSPPLQTHTKPPIVQQQPLIDMLLPTITFRAQRQICTDAIVSVANPIKPGSLLFYSASFIFKNKVTVF